MRNPSLPSTVTNRFQIDPMRESAGQSLIELALVLPLFLLILLGAAEIANFAWSSIEVSNAARAAVQYAAQNHTTASDTVGIGNAIKGDTANLTSVTWTSSISCVCATGVAKASIACATGLVTCPSPSTILEYVQVNTSAVVNPLIRYPGLPKTFTALGQATMEVEQ